MLKSFCLCLLGFLVLNLNAQSEENYNLTVRSHLPFTSGITSANIWGYTDALGNEYALVGTSRGLEIVDVTNPDEITLLFSVPHVENFWREVRTYGHYAYVTTEGNNAGLLIIDLSQLPNSIDSRIYKGDGAINNQLQTIHTIHIQDDYAYCYGSNIQEGGAVILSLSDPWNPVFVGQYGDRYIHDGIVRNDTIWACHIFDGFFSAIDVADKSNPQVLAIQETPGNFTHNSWLNDAGNVLLTTDEVENSYLTSYRIDNLNNITELHRYQTAPGSNAIVHNTHVKNDFAFTSWYTEGVVIVDAKRPENLVEVAKNDFSAFEGGGFNGCWGVYPYFPSGNIVASDIETGLWVLTPTLMRAVYLEGKITDSICNLPLENATVEIVELGISVQTDLNGEFKTGTPFQGVYDIIISKDGYESILYSQVSFVAEEVIYIERALFSEQIIELVGMVQNEEEDPIGQAFIRVNNSNISYNFQTDNSGNFNRCNLLPGNYDFIAGKWSYVTLCDNNILIDAQNDELNINLEEGYHDDFTFNFGWTVNSTATAGFWERGTPVGTTFQGVQSNPGVDVNGDCGVNAYVTGNAGGAAGNDDVDDGYTRLISPVFDATIFNTAYLSYYYWFFNAGGLSAVEDYLKVELSNGSNTVRLDSIIATSGVMSRWNRSVFKIADYITPTNNMRITFEAADLPPNGHLLEAGIDLFRVYDSLTTNLGKTIKVEEIAIFPIPTRDQITIDFKNTDPQDFPISISIFNQYGALVQKQIIANYQQFVQLDLKVSSGLYFLTGSNNERIIFTKKIPVIKN